MGINVRVQKAPKPDKVISAEIRLERDLKSCMRCRNFHGNNRQYIAKKCVKENMKQPVITEEEKQNKCFGCPYPHTEGYCFPCMKEVLGLIKKKSKVIEQEEMKDG